MPICLSLCLSIYPSEWLCSCLSVCLSVPAYICVRISVCYFCSLSIYISRPLWSPEIAEYFSHLNPGITLWPLIQVYITTTDKRPVPLTHYLYHDQNVYKLRYVCSCLLPTWYSCCYCNAAFTAIMFAVLYILALLLSFPAFLSIFTSLPVFSSLSISTSLSVSSFLRFLSQSPLLSPSLSVSSSRSWSPSINLISSFQIFLESVVSHSFQTCWRIVWRCCLWSCKGASQGKSSYIVYYEVKYLENEIVVEIMGGMEETEIGRCKGK